MPARDKNAKYFLISKSNRNVLKKIVRWRFVIIFPILTDFPMTSYFKTPISLRKHLFKLNTASEVIDLNFQSDNTLLSSLWKKEPSRRVVMFI